MKINLNSNTRGTVVFCVYSKSSIYANCELPIENICNDVYSLQSNGGVSLCEDRGDNKLVAERLHFGTKRF